MSTGPGDGVVDLRERLKNRSAVSPLLRDSPRMSRREGALTENKVKCDIDGDERGFSSDDGDARFFVDRSGVCSNDHHQHTDSSDTDNNNDISPTKSTTHKRTRSQCTGGGTPTNEGRNRRPSRPLLERQPFPPSESTTPTREKRPRYEQETDPAVLSRRQKQIEYGKNTLSYQRYTTAVPRNKREKHHPRTPCKNIKMSRRRWDNMVKSWKIHVHMWDDDKALEKLRSRTLVSPGGSGTTPLSPTSDRSSSVPSLSPQSEQKQPPPLMSPSKRRRRLSGELELAASSENGQQGASAVSDGDDEHFSWADDVDDLVKLLD